ncbi:hypothetical protein [Clostridium beijerinckii]|uniref:hypothetical protein n=1 Tax=Clostridium beijerinckii TaxID=1520 RepID=UPI00156F90A6|nr:hypothetical protein [Clostridium beijerinckii]NRU23588.1 hypothetical protein [Clostridium beijerinckii]NRW55179.1 hypothetical protein [Clostridium beijerinckii]NRW82288.1 hypothetical protein [Clostridium beijerinckii]NRX17359.1 hypothetical protein [Clostridium beijerinckii]NRY47816.1 hypothetical protein [Clostridium beijerinckii]
MDNITLIGVVGSIVSILSFFITIFMPSSHTNTNSNNKVNIDKSFNNNSFNTVTNSYTINNYKMDKSNSSKEKSKKNGKSNPDDFWGYLIIGGIITAIVIKFYITYQDLIIFWIIIFGILALLINCLLLLILSKKVYIDKKYLYFNTSKWIPLFIMLIFIYNPFYKSETFINTKKMLENTDNFIKTFQNYRADVTFVFFQIIGLIIVSVTLILYILETINDLRKVIRDPMYNIEVTKSEIIGTYLLLIIPFFWLVD